MIREKIQYGTGSERERRCRIGEPKPKDRELLDELETLGTEVKALMEQLPALITFNRS